MSSKTNPVSSMLIANEIVKEQMLQTTSKKILRPSEKTENSCVPHTHYVKTEGFMWGYGLLVFNYISTIFLYVMLEFVSK